MSFKLPVSPPATTFTSAENMVWSQEYYDSVFNTYVRPADWLALPSVISGDQKVVALHAVYDHTDNFCAFTCAGAYTVNWGDGTTNNYATGVTAYKNFTYSSFSGTESTRGYRQAIVTITPQAGQNLTSVNFNVKHNATPALPTYDAAWLDIKMAGASVLTLNVGGTTVGHKHLEQFEYVGNNVINTFSSCFSGCSSLQKVVRLYTNSSASFNAMFQNCFSLETVPEMNTGIGASFLSMFNGCSALKTVPLFNVASATTAQLMFNGCYSLLNIPQFTGFTLCTNWSGMFTNCTALKTIPLINTGAATGMSSMFQGCSSLQEIPLLNTVNNLTFQSTFQDCKSLLTIPLIDTAKSTSFLSMFQGCSALVEIPLINTGLGQNMASMFASCKSLLTIPLINTVSATAMGSMFSACDSLTHVPLLNTANVLNVQSMFANCFSLRELPLFNLAACTVINFWISGAIMTSLPNFNVGATTGTLNIASSCTNLQEIGPIDMNTVAATSIVIQNNPSLSRFRAINIKKTIDLTNCRLSAPAIVEIFNNLATVSGQTITINGNWGRTVLTAGERAIATGKGWTIVG